MLPHPAQPALAGLRIDRNRHGNAVLPKASTFERIERILSPLIHKQDDRQLADAYAVADEAFREDWEAPGMSDYDEYEKHRP